MLARILPVQTVRCVADKVTEQRHVMTEYHLSLDLGMVYLPTYLDVPVY
jgi:hypothetical protein